jgi:hypothetical protein
MDLYFQTMTSAMGTIVASAAGEPTIELADTVRAEVC